VRVVIGDGAALFREGVAALLAQHGHEVVGCAASADELSREITRHRPDLVVVDLHLPPAYTRAGSPVLAQLRSRHPDTALLVLSGSLAVEEARILVSAGVVGFGFLLKDRVSDVSGLLDAASRVAGGGSAVDPEIVARLLTPGGGRLAALSERELDVLTLLAEGRTNAAIADRLWLTRRTVEGHVRSIFTKLRLPVSPDDHRRVLAARAYLAERRPSGHRRPWDTY
jgi:DNA-binding NarL/FixJ family response regulator